MRFSSGAMALTVLGWTPGLRQIVTSRLLSCGCLVGVYEMWTGGCVEILDGRCDNCGESHHKVNRVLHWAPPECAADMRFASSSSSSGELSQLPVVEVQAVADACGFPRLKQARVPLRR